MWVLRTELCVFWTWQIILSWIVWIYAYFSTHFNYLGTERGGIVWFYEKFMFKFFKNLQTIFWQSIYTIFIYLQSLTQYFPLRKENITRFCIWQRHLAFYFMYLSVFLHVCVYITCVPDAAEVMGCTGSPGSELPRGGWDLSPVLCKKRKCTYALAVSPFSSSRFMIMPFARYLKICCKLFFILLLLR